VKQVENIYGGTYTGERALFSSRDLRIENAVFCDGESPLKESSGLELVGCRFEWKYPLWYCKDVVAKNTVLFPTARSGIWYTHGIAMNDCIINAPKTFRRSRSIALVNVTLSNAEETMWNCSDILLSDVTVCGDYFGMGSSNIVAENLSVEGNYLFDGGKNIIVKNSTLISKDAFWNCENVTVKGCRIVGEYLGWNSKNVTFIDCVIESNQGMCYMDNVKLRDCKFVNTDLCFEYCTVDAEISSHVDSVKNPISGRIVADSIGEIIHESERVDVSRTTITEVKRDV
jgi:hypothetical protein